MTTEKLLNEKPKVINIGIELFYESLVKQGAKVLQVNWKPPASSDEELLDILDRL